MEKEFRELIEDKGQAVGRYFGICSTKYCHLAYEEDNNEWIDYDILIAILNDKNRVELLCSNPYDDREIFFQYLSSFTDEEQKYLYDCFK